MAFTTRRLAALCTAALTLFAGGELAADTLYMGANVWRAKWNVGVADKNSENTLAQAPYTSALSNIGLRAITGSPFTFTTFFLNAPADANLTNYGLFGAYTFAADWSASFNLTYGKTNFDSSHTTVYNTGNAGSIESCGASCTVTTLGTDTRSLAEVAHRVEAERKDLDLILSRRLGDSGFAIFGGLKGQDWDYSTPLTIGPSFRTGTITNPATGATGSGDSVGLAAFEYQYRSEALGPAAGLSYTYVIDDVQALSAQVGGIFLFGTVELKETNTIALGSYQTTVGSFTSTVPAGNAIISDKTTDRIRMPGYTVRVDYRYKVGNVILRAGMFYQETTLQSRAPNNEGLALLSGISVPIPITPRSLQTQYSVDGARDIFKGFTISASTQIF